MAADIILSFDRGTLLADGLPAGDAPTGDQRIGWVWDKRVAAWRCEAIHYAMVSREMSQRFADRWVDRVPQPAAIRWPTVDLPTLRSEQNEALAGWNLHQRRGLVVMPTGTGKTEVALAAMAGTCVATLIVAPVRDLMYQWHRRILRGLGYDAGIVGDNLFDLRPVTVTTYDSAYLHMPNMGDKFGLVVFDEAHHLPGRCRREAALFAAAPMRLGLTATPERSDGRHDDLDHLIGPIVCRIEMPRVKGKTLAEYEVHRIPIALKDDEQKRYEEAGRVIQTYIADRREQQPGFTWQDLCAEAGHAPEARRAQKAHYLRKSIEDRAAEKLRVLEDLFRLHAGERTIVFTGTNVMAIEISQRFLIPTLLSHSRKRERLETLEAFAAGRFPAIVANRVLDEGVDVPEAKVAVVLGGQASTRQATQRLGRILRKTGDRLAILYEVVCQDTTETKRSRTRRRSDAYQRTRHHRL